MERSYRNVNEAFVDMVAGFSSGRIPTVRRESRNGPVMRVQGPTLITYEEPRERVLFIQGRDANPFFHLFESLWMLAGRDDVAPLKYYVDNIDQFSDDGKVFNGAYGHRWRSWFGYDQLSMAADELVKNKETRRLVVTMWDGKWDLNYSCMGGKDAPCNLQVMFEVDDGKLNMTVTNRSNDMILGMFGANVVHFSFLHEYMANLIDVPVGRYNQFSNNLHAYLEKPYKWDPKKWIGEYDPAVRTMHSPKMIQYAEDLEDREVNGGVLPCEYKLVQNALVFDREVRQFIDNPFQDWKEPFLNCVAKPMMQAFKHHKARQYDLAYEAVNRVAAEDWMINGRQWLARRERMWASKNDPANPYRAQEDKRAEAT